jgi:hypothetical protein
MCEVRVNFDSGFRWKPRRRIFLCVSIAFFSGIWFAVGIDQHSWSCLFRFSVVEFNRDYRMRWGNGEVYGGVHWTSWPLNQRRRFRKWLMVIALISANVFWSELMIAIVILIHLALRLVGDPRIFRIWFIESQFQLDSWFLCNQNNLLCIHGISEYCISRKVKRSFADRTCVFFGTELVHIASFFGYVFSDQASCTVQLNRYVNPLRELTQFSFIYNVWSTFLFLSGHPWIADFSRHSPIASGNFVGSNSLSQ